MNKTYTVVLGDKIKTNVATALAATDDMLRNQLKGDYSDPLKYFIGRRFDTESGIETVTLHKIDKAQIVIGGIASDIGIKDALTDDVVKGLAAKAGLVGEEVIQRAVLTGVMTVTVTVPGRRSGEAEPTKPAKDADDPLAALAESDAGPINATAPVPVVNVQIYDKVIPVPVKETKTDAALCRALEKDFPILKAPGAVDIKRDAITSIITIVPKQVERYVAIVEGTAPVEINSQVAVDDEVVTALLRPHYGGVDGAQIKRKFVNGMVELHFIKQGGPKGSMQRQMQGVRTQVMASEQAWQYLIACKSHVNPMIATWRKIEDLRQEGPLDLYTLMYARTAMQRALKMGPQEVAWVHHAYAGLVSAAAILCQHVPVGF